MGTGAQILDSYPKKTRTSSQISKQKAAHRALFSKAYGDKRIRKALPVFCFLMDRHNYKANCPPFHKLKTIAHACGLHTRSVERAIQLLAEHGYIVFTKVNGKPAYRLTEPGTTNLSDKSVGEYDKSVGEYDKSVETCDKSVETCDKSVSRDPINTKNRIKTRTNLTRLRGSAREESPKILKMEQQEEQQLRDRFSEYEKLFGSGGTYRFIGRDKDVMILSTRDPFDQAWFEDRYRSRVPWPCRVVLDGSGESCYNSETVSQ